MPNLHVRDVPPEAVEALKRTAERHGRSLNAELVGTLVAAAERARRDGDLLERIECSRRRWQEIFPGGIPPELDPVHVIRQARDTRYGARH